MKREGSLTQKITARKEQHLAICLNEQVEHAKRPFEDFALQVEALPQTNEATIDTSATLLTRQFSIPLLFGAMTGGTKRAHRINLLLAEVAQEFNLPFALGSQRAMLRDPSTTTYFNVVKSFPKTFVIGNLGLTALRQEFSCDDLPRLVDTTGLSALALHLNALQECIQPEGERNFEHMLETLALAVKKSPVPIIVKEVGCGISAETFKRLASTGVAAVDIAGKGGTSWALVESFRGNNFTRRLGMLFGEWGIPTDAALLQSLQARQNQSTPELIASGGIRDGIQIAKAIALGADFCAMALPLLRAAEAALATKAPQEHFADEIRLIQTTYRTALFCTGARNQQELRGKIAPKIESKT